MTEWVSPIDGHRHFSDAGRVGCAVCELEAERDRLRTVVTDAWCALFGAGRVEEAVEPLSDEHAHMVPAVVRSALAAAAQAQLAVEAERDEARTEVDRLRIALRAVMTETGTSSLAHHYARYALDGNADIGRPTCPDCGNPLRFCDCPKPVG